MCKFLSTFRVDTSGNSTRYAPKPTHVILNKKTPYQYEPAEVLVAHLALEAGHKAARGLGEDAVHDAVGERVVAVAQQILPVNQKVVILRNTTADHTEWQPGNHIYPTAQVVCSACMIVLD